MCKQMLRGGGGGGKTEMDRYDYTAGRVVGLVVLFYYGLFIFFLSRQLLKTVGSFSKHVQTCLIS